MSDGKKKYNGRFQYYEHGYVGIKDRDDKVIISTKLRYMKIFEREDEDVIIVSRDNKWALADLDGKPLCPFIYDRIVYVGEHCYKAGIYVKPDNGEIIVEYADTRMTYAILDDNGKVLCSRDKGYNYISEIHEGEVTAAINGRCGIIDFYGNVIIDFRYKYIQPMGEGHYYVSFYNQNSYFTTIIDRKCDVLISADMEYCSIGDFHNGVARAYQKGKWGLIDGKGRHISEFEYSFIDEWGEGYYKAEKGVRKNIMRPDGSVVLQEWVNNVYKVTNGFFIFGNTIKKSKTNSKTRYIEGVAHVNGDVIFPMIFERVNWLDDNKAIYAEIGNKSYILTLNGGVYDPQRNHLPQKKEIDMKSFFESIANWVLPGLQFFYRDTNAIIDAARVYRVGDTIRAGFFVDATTKLLKPAHKTRFLIASAHAARLYEIEQLVKDNPNILKWNLVTFHFNSFFKVMDVYKTPQCTQVLLLHIPKSAAAFLNGTMAFNFLNGALGSRTSLVQLARRNLDEKLKMVYHERSLDEEWRKRMEYPVGLSEELTLCPLEPIPEPEDKYIAGLSKAVHRLAEDADIEFKTVVSDNYPWKGVKGSVCQGCIFANTIIGKGEGCAELHKDEFRKNYVNGICLYRKESYYKDSVFEQEECRNAEESKDEEKKATNVQAVRLIKDFIEEVLDGDIEKLRDYDLSSIQGKYADNDVSRSKVVMSIMALVFSDVWPDLNVYNIEHSLYKCDEMNIYQNLLGINMFDEYFRGMEKFHPTKEQHQRAVRVAHLINSIGNFWVLPNFGMQKNDYRYRSYMDKFLQGMYEVFTGQDKMDKKLQAIFHSKRKLMVDYQGEAGFHKFIRNMMLEDYVDEAGMPKEIFMFVWSMKKDLNRDDYFKAVDIFCSFCEKAISRRAERIIEKLKMIIGK
ncbi:MAG: WG repeat-containing protein [Prevotella sp.]|nr:WG repeat-containing protein [Prevotella sp.]